MDTPQSHETHLAEAPRAGELWREMIERQRRESGNIEEGGRQLMRSLPDEHQKEKTNKSQDEIILPHDLFAKAPISYQDMLRDASQVAGREHDQGIDR
jgi:hypothetical protein